MKNVNWGLIFIVVSIIVFWIFLIVNLVSCAPSQKEINDHYYDEVMDTTEHNETMDSLRNINIDSLIQSIINDTTK